jgi:malonyl-CoA O-methyltransferase
VREELLTRLAEFTPGTGPATGGTVLDLGCGSGAATAALRARQPIGGSWGRGKGQVIALDIAPGMLREAGRHQRPWRRFARVAADAAQLPLVAASVDVVFSSLMLQWFADPALVFAEVARVLRPGGLLLFATFGPDTLRELRAAWDDADPQGVHVNRFIDMHDLGGALQGTGFAEPVLDVDRHRVLYPDVRALLAELKTIGAHNVNAGRARALTGRRRFETMVASYETLRLPGGLPATWEVVYGTAWMGAPREPAMAIEAETRFSPQALLAKLRGRR